jgi:hypothetical protein
MKPNEKSDKMKFCEISGDGSNFPEISRTVAFLS